MSEDFKGKEKRSSSRRKEDVEVRRMITALVTQVTTADKKADAAIASIEEHNKKCFAATTAMSSRLGVIEDAVTPMSQWFAAKQIRQKAFTEITVTVSRFLFNLLRDGISGVVGKVLAIGILILLAGKSPLVDKLLALAFSH